MIKAQHKKFWEWFFVTYSKIYLWFIFREIRYIPLYKENVNKDRSVVIISNHFFFWDGFIHLLLNRKFFKRKIHIMMLHEELVKRRFLRYGGTFSIEKGRRSIIESLDYCRDVLNNPANSLLIFPQGKIESLYTNPFIFEKGIEYILKSTDNADIYLNINHINFNSNRRPTLLMYLKPLSVTADGHRMKIENIEQEFNRFAAEVKEMENSNSDNFI
ncbi:MAG: 1-acyl-sn-glycerol-3-phosphate acyltransferase [Bacteroidales bacterium]